VLERAELAPGDFVRNAKQLIDLLRQLAVVAPDPATAATAHAAATALQRGVVAASAAPAGATEDPDGSTDAAAGATEDPAGGDEGAEPDLEGPGDGAETAGPGVALGPPRGL